MQYNDRKKQTKEKNRIIKNLNDVAKRKQITSQQQQQQQ